ncbi:MAG TPA: gluconokinase [Chloroflexota bacterium]
MAAARAKEVVLALDVGTSSCRASLYDTRGRRVGGRAAAQASYQPRTTADGGAELDAAHLLDQVCEVMHQVLRQNRRNKILGVGTSTFWHSLLGLGARGQPRTPVYLWLDARSRTQAARLRDDLDAGATHARVGCVVHWSYWPAKLLWLRETQPELFASVHRWVSFGEYFLEQLTGLRGVSVSMASGTGLFNQHTLDWDAELLEHLSLDRDRLPSIVPLAGSATAQHEPSLAKVPWVPAVGDGACSNLGAGCATPERFALMVGTSGAERVIWAPDELEIPWGTWCYRVDERRVVLGGALNDGGSLFDWLRRGLRLPSIAASEVELAELEPDGHGLTVLPFWGGERSPGWAQDATGAVLGLRLHTRPIDILRAALEAIALRFGELDRILLEAMPGAREVVATGAALLHSPAWLQIMADVLGRPVLASSEPQGSSRGVALLTLETLGYLDSPLASLEPEIRARFEPVPEWTGRYRAAGERQRHVYDLLVRS